jgi:uncharacterized membrane protein
MENKWAVLFFLFGICILLWEFLVGNATGGVFVIFPFIYSKSLFGFFGITLIFVSLLLFVTSLPQRIIHQNQYNSKEKGRVKRQWEGIVFIGPIPLIFSHMNPRIKLLLALAGMLIFVLVWVVILVWYTT